MKIGDSIKHKDDNTGQGPEGSWIIKSFDFDSRFNDIVYFSDDTWCEIGWIKSEIENGNAFLINQMCQHRIPKHDFIQTPEYLPF